MPFISLYFQIFRHGYRSPIDGYPSDEIKEDQWPQGFGQLTAKNLGNILFLSSFSWINLERHEQHHKLGLWLHERYMVNNALLNETYKKSEIWIRSSAYDRTIMSAQSCLSGLYMLKEKNIMELLWTPIPVWTEKMQSDYLMSPWHCPCPRFTTLQKDRMKNPKIKEYMDNNKEFFNFLQEKSGLSENSTFWNYTRLADTIVMELDDNRTVNQWAQNETVQLKLKTLLDIGSGFNFANATAEETSIVSGLILKEISHSFNDIVTNSMHHQAHIFSGHDTTLAPLLAALSAKEIDHKPTPASCILLELYQDDKTFTVEMHYRNGTDEKVTKISIKSCSASSCPLEEFQKFVSPFIPEDIKKTCHYIPEGSSPSGNFILAVLVISILVVFLAIIICLFKGCKGRAHLFKKQSRFEPINFQLLGNPGSDSEDAEVFDVKSQ
ncbi:putative lysosomal acid phosphatase [Apostichopus japonicus]|uniref:Putative lysosomal acid phosphatase n=1 Tax=Stichopus japonicus TaxID=307972 RepID=A0A2G8LFX6_STIJA|nr:putative lysosomal acid phosphatase [Apostichopus japonicus]